MNDLSIQKIILNDKQQEVNAWTNEMESKEYGKNEVLLHFILLRQFIKFLDPAPKTSANSGSNLMRAWITETFVSIPLCFL